MTSNTSDTSKQGLKVLLLGPPGAGKGTQAARLIQSGDFQLVATGDILRRAVAADTPLGQQVNAYMKAGKLVPDNTIVDVVIDYLRSFENSTNSSSHFLFDGFPRTIEQAQALRNSYGELNAIVGMEIDGKVLLKRLTGRRIHPASGRIYHLEYSPPKVAGLDDLTGEPLVHREDDHAEAISVRLNAYHEATQPLMAYYQNLADKGELQFARIQADAAMEDIAADIANFIKRLKN